LYKVDRDEVWPIERFPWPDAGAPCPLVLANEQSVWLAYYVDKRDSLFEEKFSKIWTDSDELCIEESVAIIHFKSPRIHVFGDPSEEAIDGHPLRELGLERCSVAEVLNSSWILELDRIDSLTHPEWATQRRLQQRHFIFTFHDSTFECVAQDLSFSIRHGEPLQQLMEAMRE
jgi:hypothetical protein